MNSSEAYCPDQGDFIWLDNDPSKGHEQSGHRPGLVLSPRAYNVRSGLCVIAPITSRKVKYSFDTEIPHGLGIAGLVIADQVSSKSWTQRRSRFIGVAPRALVDDVVAKFKALLP